MVKIITAGPENVDRIYELILADAFNFDNGSGSLLPLDQEEISGLVDDGRFFLAYANDEVVGCASVISYAYDGERVAELRSLKVDPDYRGQGVSKDLLRYGIGVAQGLGYSELYSLTSEEALPAFEKAGFEVVADRPTPKVQRDCKGCAFYESPNCKEMTVVYRR